VIANIWQVLLSYLYVAHNSILSCLLVADEWFGFAREQKRLRVSALVGIQRSSYFISMPLLYGIPMMAIFALEHWLLSQSTSVSSVMVFEWNDDPQHDTPSAIFIAGFSIFPAFFGTRSTSYLSFEALLIDS
jgi:hypothetical protein